MRWFVAMAVMLGACDDESPSKDVSATDAATEVSGDTADEVASTETGGATDVVEDSATPTEVDAETVADAGPEIDAVEPDTEEVREVEPFEDADTIEVSPSLPLPGFGAITGDCGVLDDELLDYVHPSFFVNHIDFGTNGWDDSELEELTEGAQIMYGNGTAGGSSIESEMFAFEVLARCELAGLVKTETEVVYDPIGSKKTDILVGMDDLKIGVSVLRAFHFPPSEPYTEQDALTKLTDKLVGINESSKNVVESDKWAKQILHIIAYDAPHVDTLRKVWDGLSTDLKKDTIIIVTVTDGDDAILY